MLAKKRKSDVSYECSGALCCLECISTRVYLVNKKKKRFAIRVRFFFFFLMNIVSIFKRFYKRNRLTKMTRTERVVPGRPLQSYVHFTLTPVFRSGGLSSLLFVFLLLPELPPFTGHPYNNARTRVQ